MIILDVNKLAKNFGYGQLFEDVSFLLNEGESISIVGPNGSGKSTILKMIVGLEKIDSGSINIKKDAIEDFDGTLIFVSHDRYFINKFADKTIEFKNGHISTYLGNYDYYKEKRAGRKTL